MPIGTIVSILLLIASCASYRVLKPGHAPKIMTSLSFHIKRKDMPTVDESRAALKDSVIADYYYF